ncbi:MAG: hypothetical protein F6J90_13665 [Moorea sp. SIOASIH]|uniref:hypothetical protein n=1 Tax=Moorena sp. SIOASIH TaxID=2607817 RepID=UPI0013B77A77|nr:hypothetical protein [Moorena sp. SIOASIH]NEO37313.1 hypothetical protein [Moorena sp. SIOASIH]
MGRWGDEEMGRWVDGEMGRWDIFLLKVIIQTLSKTLLIYKNLCLRLILSK